MDRGYGIRAAVNWVTLATPVGLLLARLTRCPVVSGPRGLHHAIGYRARIPNGAAFVVGNVVFVRDERLLKNEILMAHEERHATQWACCLGIFGFPLLYGGSMLWSWAATGDYFSQNPFERAAGLQQGNYIASPARWRKDRL